MSSSIAHEWAGTNVWAEGNAWMDMGGSVARPRDGPLIAMNLR